MDSITDRKAKRFLVLQAIYDAANGRSQKMVRFRQIIEESGLRRIEVDDALSYLHGAGLALVQNMYVGITHEGVKQIEEGRNEPEQEAHYSLPMNVINVQNMVGSQIQQASHGSTQTQTINVSDLGAVREWIEEYRRALPDLPLPPESRTEAAAELATVDAQLQSSKPKPVILGESLKTLRALLEGLASNIAAAELIKHFGRFLGLPI